MTSMSHKSVCAFAILLIGIDAIVTTLIITSSFLLGFVGAMLMAWYLKDMNARELATLTNTMTHSGMKYHKIDFCKTLID